MALKERDRCRLSVAWGDGSHRGKTCQVVGFQKHGLQTFVKVIWIGADAKALKEEYGNVFGEEELVKL